MSSEEEVKLSVRIGQRKVMLLHVIVEVYHLGSTEINVIFKN